MADNHPGHLRRFFQILNFLSDHRDRLRREGFLGDGATDLRRELERGHLALWYR